MMFVPQWMKDEVARLEASDDPLENLGSLHLLADWIEDMKLFAAEEARKKRRTLEEIAVVEHRPRQAVHRRLKTAHSRSKGFTSPDFDGISSSTLRYWFDWWSDPRRDKNGTEEAGRDPATEAEKVRKELEARYDAGLLRRPVGGLKDIRRG